MASMSVSEEDLSCPVCCDIFKDPVLLECSHSFCKGCLKTFWQGKGSRECPVCRAKCSQNDPPRNLLLKNMCEAFLKEMKKPKARKEKEGQKKPLCSLHQSELKLFCEDDKQLLCLVCRDSKLHKNHNSIPIDEAALEHKGTLKTTLKSFEDKLKTFNDVKLSCAKSAQHIKVQTQQTEKQIKEEFRKLHQFLRNEEASRIAAVRREEKQKSQMMKEKIEKMNRDISSLSNAIKGIEEGLKVDDITFLQNYKSTEQRAQCTLQDPERLSGALINVAKHLGNLKFRVWEKMKDLVQYSPVILDPNTARERLTLSEDLTCLTCIGQVQTLPDNPERFADVSFVLGSEGFSFNSGTHCWDVEVLCLEPGEDRSNWSLGVITESVSRSGEDWQLGLWCVHNVHGSFVGQFTGAPCIPLTLRQYPQRIRVQLDCNRGELSFTYSNTKEHIITLKHTFTETVFPCFSACMCLMKIVPVKPTIVLGENNDRTVLGQEKDRTFGFDLSSCALL